MKSSASLDKCIPHLSLQVDKFNILFVTQKRKKKESDMIIDREINRLLIEQSINTSIN